MFRYTKRLLQSIKNRTHHTRSPHQILGLPHYANRRQIRAAFKKLAKKYHPDVNPEGTHEFIIIRDAYEELMSGKTSTTQQQQQQQHQPHNDNHRQQTQHPEEDHTHYQNNTEYSTESHAHTNASIKISLYQRFLQNMHPSLRVPVVRVVSILQMGLEMAVVVFVFGTGFIMFAMFVDVISGNVRDFAYQDTPPMRLRKFVSQRITSLEQKLNEREMEIADWLFDARLETLLGLVGLPKKSTLNNSEESANNESQQPLRASDFPLRQTSSSLSY